MYTARLGRRDVSAPCGHIKGSAVRELVIWYQRAHDASLLRAVAAAMPPELDAQLEPDAPGLGMLASRWYDARVMHLLLDASAGKSFRIPHPRPPPS